MQDEVEQGDRAVCHQCTETPLCADMQLSQGALSTVVFLFC